MEFQFRAIDGVRRPPLQPPLLASYSSASLEGVSSSTLVSRATEDLADALRRHLNSQRERLIEAEVTRRVTEAEVRKELMEIEKALERAVGTGTPVSRQTHDLVNALRRHSQIQSEQLSKVTTNSIETEAWKELIEMELLLECWVHAGLGMKLDMQYSFSGMNKEQQLSQPAVPTETNLGSNKDKMVVLTKPVPTSHGPTMQKASSTTSDNSGTEQLLFTPNKKLKEDWKVCDLCNIRTNNSDATWIAHVQGKNHIAKEEKQRAQTQSNDKNLSIAPISEEKGTDHGRTSGCGHGEVGSQRGGEQDAKMSQKIEQLLEQELVPDEEVLENENHEHGEKIGSQKQNFAFRCDVQCRHTPSCYNGSSQKW